MLTFGKHVRVLRPGQFTATAIDSENFCCRQFWCDRSIKEGAAFGVLDENPLE